MRNSATERGKNEHTKNTSLAEIEKYKKKWGTSRLFRAR